MKNRILLIAWMVCAFAPAATAQSTAVSVDVIRALEAAVFEVVVPRNEDPQIKYERELPWDTVPYAVRTDQYLSIGTAFRISTGEIVSAAHVFSVINLSQNKNYYLRDGAKNLYKITDVYKYSNYRDFISFKAEGLPEHRGLDVQTQTTLNERVYAVGNAYGEGIVIRDGLLTSYTPEMEEGEWDWIRFSAAASPGNSGGPLINHSGEVIGIITMKSQNENLNYALPISEYLNAPENTAAAYMKLKYSVPIFFDYFKRGIFSHSVELPLNLQQLSAEMFAAYDRWTGRLVAEIKREWKEKGFPKGEGSETVLSGVFQTTLPHMVGQGPDGRWGLFRPQQLQETRVDGNGSWTYGVLGGFTLASFVFPDGLDAERFFSDSRFMGEEILKGFPIYRNFASERVRITSLGKADKFSLYTDAYKRKWIIADYNIGFNDAKVLFFATPTPEGAALMIQMDTTDAVRTGHLRDFKLMADYVHLSYRGTFLQWERFLKLKDLVPPTAADVAVAALPNGVDLKCGPAALRYAGSAFNWSSQSLLTVLPGFEKLRSGELDWVVKGFLLQENMSDSGTVSVNRIFNPGEGADPSARFIWEKMKNKEEPFNGEIHSSGNYHQVYQIITGADPNMLYAAAVGSSVAARKETLKAESVNIRKNLRINDFRMSEILNPPPVTEKPQPNSDNSQSSAEDSQPKSENFQPNSENFQPKSDNFQPNSENFQPKSDNSQPKSDNFQPNSENFQSNSDNFQPNSENSQRKSDNFQPKSDNSQPKSDNFQPNSENSQPKSDNFQPKSDNFQSKSDNFQSKSDNFQPKSDNFQPKSENFQPKSENFQPKSDNSQPKSDNFQPKSDNFQPKSDNFQPKSENSQQNEENSSFDAEHFSDFFRLDFPPMEPNFTKPEKPSAAVESETRSVRPWIQ